jgi:hypothetical protein
MKRSGYFTEKDWEGKRCAVCGKPATCMCSNIPFFLCGYPVCDECNCPCCKDRSGVTKSGKQIND